MNQPILCFDYGTKRIGVAIATTPLAEPLTIIPNDSKALNNCAALCIKHQATLLVVGLSEGAMAKTSRQFAQALSETSGIPVSFQDETLSSFDTHQYLVASKAKASVKRRPIDHLAAAAILQDYLDEQVK